MADKKQILFINQEMAPYLPSSPLSTFTRDLVTKLHGKSCEVRTFLPKFGSVNERRNQLHEVIRLSGANIQISENDHPLVLKVASLPPARVQVYFIDTEDFFQKDDNDADALGSNRPDNDERMLFYAHGTADTVNRLKWEPHIIHVTGWFASLIPLYMRKLAREVPAFDNARIVYSVTPEVPRATLSGALYKKLAADNALDPAMVPAGEAPVTVADLHRLAILNADAVVFTGTDPDPDLLALAREKNMPVLMAPDGTQPEQYREFYASL